MAAHDLANAARVGVIDPDLDAVERNAHRVELDLAGAMDRVRTHQLCLTVQLTQRNAERLEEAERVGAERGAAGGCGAQPRKSQAVTQGRNSRKSASGERSAVPLPTAAMPTFIPMLNANRFSGDASMHAGTDVRSDLLPGARGEQQEGRADFAQVGHQLSRVPRRS